MKVGMIQSSYLPWRGYFDFIDDVDLFVVYDDVKYSHRTWRNRNQIKTSTGPMWISVPVIHDSSTLIQRAEIDNKSRWAEKHIRSIKLAYQKAPFYAKYCDELFMLLSEHEATISALNVKLMRWVMRCLGIQTKLCMSSEFSSTGDKYERPLNILKELGATAYLSGPTAKPYTDAGSFERAGISLEYKSYAYRPYVQLFGEYVPNVSVIDLLFNNGDNSKSLFKSHIPNERVI